MRPSYLSEQQQRALGLLARARQSTASALIREAVDAYLGQETPASKVALRAKVAGAWANDRAPLDVRALRREERGL